METKRVETWQDFVDAVEYLRKTYGLFRRELENGKVYEDRNTLLFRGQSNAEWPLLTTLERKTEIPFHVLKYLHCATRHVSEIESFTEARWSVPNYPALETELNEKQEVFRVALPAYDYLVYLMHHDFPSPLLDWTESPYIAAYFAYINATKDGAAVYCYIERPERIKGGTGGSPMITLLGPYITTHKRHFAQKSWYTVSTEWNYGEKRHYFCPHEKVFERNNQDLLFKIVLPISERKKALAYLNDYNINHFTLFQSEDSLIKAIATREFDIHDV